MRGTWVLRSGRGRVPKPLGAAPPAPVCGVLWGCSWVFRMPNRAHGSSNISNCSFAGTARAAPRLSFSPFLYSPTLHATLVSPFRARPQGLTSTVLGKPPSGIPGDSFQLPSEQPALLSVYIQPIRQHPPATCSKLSPPNAWEGSRHTEGAQ